MLNTATIEASACRIFLRASILGKYCPLLASEAKVYNHLISQQDEVSIFPFQEEKSKNLRSKGLSFDSHICNDNPTRNYTKKWKTQINII